MSIAKKLGYDDASTLVAMNKWKYEGLTKTAKLHAGTALDLPELGEEVSLPTLGTPGGRKMMSIGNECTDAGGEGPHDWIIFVRGVKGEKEKVLSLGIKANPNPNPNPNPNSNSYPNPNPNTNPNPNPNPNPNWRRKKCCHLV